ncbi:MAG: DUF2007 domain-containing protein [Candidatus Acidiferrales bacterium]
MKLCEFRDLPEALVAKGILDSAGIECLLGDENTVRMDWFWSNAIGGVKLWLRRQDVAAAVALLDEKIPDGFDVDGVGEYEQPKCERCGSLDVSFEELNRPVAYSSLFVGLPFPLKHRGWRCHSCGHKWPEPSSIHRVGPA